MQPPKSEWDHPGILVPLSCSLSKNHEFPTRNSRGLWDWRAPRNPASNRTVARHGRREPERDVYVLPKRTVGSRSLEHLNIPAVPKRKSKKKNISIRALCHKLQGCTPIIDTAYRNQYLQRVMFIRFLFSRIIHELRDKSTAPDGRRVDMTHHSFSEIFLPLPDHLKVSAV